MRPRIDPSLQRPSKADRSAKSGAPVRTAWKRSKVNGAFHLGPSSRNKLQSVTKNLTSRKTKRLRKALTASDLEKVLHSTDVATILLDADLNIRFFTPATKLLFNIRSEDIGRPLGDISSLAPDEALLRDAGRVLQAIETIDREIESKSGAWYIRRILPYRTDGKKIEGIVITFADITHQKEAATALEYARLQADSANIAKSRFLAAASHDLRQPLQALVLLQELLAKVLKIVIQKASP